ATKGGKRKQARDMLQAIEDAANTLKVNLEAMIEKKKEIQLTKGVLAALDSLLEQVKSASADGFKNELDNQRWKRWLPDKPGTEKPLTEDQIVPGTRTQIGVGAQGPVFKCQLDPELGRSPVVLKYDSNGLNGDAITAGIP